MRIKYFGVFLAAAVLVALAIVASCSVGVSTAFAADLNGVRYVKCYDGDTCTVLAPYLPEPFTRLRVRVARVDAPEIRGKCKQEKELAMKARDAVNGWMASARTIDLQHVTLGMYGRVEADIVLNGRVGVRELLLKNGLAVESAGKRAFDWCAKTSKGNGA